MQDERQRQADHERPTESILMADSGGMDALSAHLDRGWEMLSRGDVQAARQSAKQALDVDAQSPEAHTLWGAVSFSEGQPEDALLEFERAMDLDPDNPEPLVYSAEVLAKEPETAEEALVRAQEALHFLWGTEAQDLKVQAVLVKAEALLVLGRAEEARQWLESNLAELGEAPAFYERSGAILAQVGLHREARDFLLSCLEGPHSGTAHHLLGHYALQEGRRDEAVDRFVETRFHDLQEPGPAWAYSYDAFWELTGRAVRAAADRHGILLRDEDVFLESYPGLEAILDGQDPRAAAVGDWWPEGRRHGGAYVIVYQWNVERLCVYPDEVPERLDAELDALFQRLAEQRPKT